MIHISHITGSRGKKRAVVVRDSLLVIRAVRSVGLGAFIRIYQCCGLWHFSEAENRLK